MIAVTVEDRSNSNWSFTCMLPAAAFLVCCCKGCIRGGEGAEYIPLSFLSFLQFHCLQTYETDYFIFCFVRCGISLNSGDVPGPFFLRWVIFKAAILPLIVNSNPLHAFLLEQIIVGHQNILWRCSFHCKGKWSHCQCIVPLLQFVLFSMFVTGLKLTGNSINSVLKKIDNNSAHEKHATNIKILLNTVM